MAAERRDALDRARKFGKLFAAQDPTLSIIMGDSRGASMKWASPVYVYGT